MLWLLARAFFDVCKSVISCHDAEYFFLTNKRQLRILVLLVNRMCALIILHFFATAAHCDEIDTAED